MAPRKTSTRVVTNRAALDKAWLAVADGLLEVGQAIVDDAHPPDATPYGQGLVDRGAAAVWVNGKKIGGGADKPRGIRVRQYPIVGVAGFGFPARYQETGTVHQPARPFLTPAAVRVKGNAAGTIRDVVGRQTGGRR
jgi:hypothetical protein